jgi:hypothetical protein
MAPVLVLLSLYGCHHEVEMTPLVERTIYVTDQFWRRDVAVKDRALVVGYVGKILGTNGGGRNWTVIRAASTGRSTAST